MVTQDRDSIKLSLNVSAELNQKLDELARETHSTKSDVLRRAIVLFDVIASAERDGRKVGIAKDNDSSVLEKEFVFF